MRPTLKKHEQENILVGYASKMVTEEENIQKWNGFNHDLVLRRAFRIFLSRTLDFRANTDFVA